MRSREVKQFDSCLAQKHNPESIRRKQKPNTHEINMELAIQYVVNPPAKLPDGFKFGPVFV